MTHQTKPLALLRDTEHYLSALHGSVARHDNLAANYGCAGCELRDRITAALPEITASAADWDDLVREADRLRRDGAALHARAEELDNQLTALRQQVTEPTDKAAVLRWAAQRLYTGLFPAVYNDLGQKAAEGVNRAVSALRRMADETATETPQPHRGDAFEQWLKARRDEWAPEGCQPWQILDQTLEEYRLHADTGTPLGEHVCEGKAAGAQQDETATETPDVYLTTPCDACDHTLNWHSSGETGCTVPRCACARYYHAAGARQDGAET